MARDCWLKNEVTKSNVATFKQGDEWDAHAFFTTIEEAAFIATTSEHIDYEKDWIIDLGCSNHMIGNKENCRI